MVAHSGAYLGPTGSARFLVSDRDGVRRDPTLPTRAGGGVQLGSSARPFDAFDLALHVGDDEQDVLANRLGLLGALSPAVGSVTFMDQVHGNRVAVVDRGDVGVVPTADAIVTSVPGAALAVLVADCVPVVLADESAGVVGVVHAGRAGVQSDVVGAAVRTMTELGANPGAVSAVIGPAICPSCYEVPAAMADEVAAVVPAARDVSANGTPALHLRRAVAAQLAAAGVTAVDAVGGCTAEDRSLYSYRRDVRTGRFAMVAWVGDRR